MLEIPERLKTRRSRTSECKKDRKGRRSGAPENKKVQNVGKLRKLAGPARWKDESLEARSFSVLAQNRIAAHQSSVKRAQRFCPPSNFSRSQSSPFRSRTGTKAYATHSHHPGLPLFHRSVCPCSTRNGISQAKGARGRGERTRRHPPERNEGTRGHPPERKGRASRTPAAWAT